jgi:hypothetical protein
VTPFAWFMRQLDAIGSQPLGARVRQCPSHLDEHPSLSIQPGRNGAVLLRCHGGLGCTVDEVLAALRHPTRARMFQPPRVSPEKFVEMTDLRIAFPKVVLRVSHPTARGFKLESLHDYGRARLVRFRHPTTHKKELQWESLSDSGRWLPGLFKVTLQDLGLYREREVLQAVGMGEPVALVESESSVDSITGTFSTTWPGSATSINFDRIRSVLGTYPRTVLVPDSDPAGRQVVRHLAAAGLTFPVLWPDEGKDARDLFAQLGPAEFAAAIARTAGQQTQTMEAAA